MTYKMRNHSGESESSEGLTRKPAESYKRAEGDKGPWTPEQVEAFLVEAAWVLRVMPDKESGFMAVRTTIWPKYKNDYNPLYQLSKRSGGRSGRPTPREIDRYLLILEWVEMIPDLLDRNIVFWACWQLNGMARAGLGDRLPWTKIITHIPGLRMSRWQLRRRHVNALDLIARVLTQRKFNF